MAGFPQSSEVWANSINLHFHFAFLTGLIAAIPIFDGYPKLIFRFLLLLAGLSGIPANFLAPLFIGQAVLTRHRERYVQSLIISSTAIIQLVLDELSTILRKALDHNEEYLVFAVVCSFLILYIAKKAIESKDRIVLILLTCAFLLTVLSIST